MKKSDKTAIMYSLVTLLTFISGYLYGQGKIFSFLLIAVVVIALDFFAVRCWFKTLQEMLYENHNGFERICTKSKNSGRDLELLEQIGREDQRDLIRQ